MPPSPADSACPSPLVRYLPLVQNYLRLVRPPVPEVTSWESIEITPLAAGEYNINFLLSGACAPSVFRINIASQLKRNDQIIYEYKALELLRDSGVTPEPYYVDNTRDTLDRGLLIMEYLPGQPLDYSRDILGAARVFSAIHRIQPAEDIIHLIEEKQPLDIIYQECTELLETYFQSPLADPGITKLLEKILIRNDQNRFKEHYYLEDPWFCIVNTEVNSGNFIVNRELQTTHLIDWEMPRWGDPSTDLCHFISPLTTLWKTNFRFDQHKTEQFLETYREEINDPHLAATLDERMHLKMPYVLMRGISWSAMAWVAYQGEYHGIRNQDTWSTLNGYMEAGFIRSLFTPYMEL